MPRPVHFEIHAEDPERAIRFYTQVFDWSFTHYEGMEPAYWGIVTGPDSEPGLNGGLMRRNGPAPVDGAAVNCYVCTIQVENIDLYSARIKAANGQQTVEKMPIPQTGWLAYFKDTEGNIFGCMEFDQTAGE
ncbi:VOC family protein [Parvularcula sp. IMCC14364]|uniref:VOC family protein n=1 Tax=Parvularcula sp. IMCC14364 TaxID=3067902 RepID=UPI00274100A6|nr:VOC family protein [Parvularcula sp. IMCC14364]